MKDSHTKLTFHVCQYNDTQRLATLRHTGKFFKKKKTRSKINENNYFTLAQSAFLELFKL